MKLRETPCLREDRGRSLGRCGVSPLKGVCGKLQGCRQGECLPPHLPDK